jgi:hypothetical protein
MCVCMYIRILYLYAIDDFLVGQLAIKLLNQHINKQELNCLNWTEFYCYSQHNKTVFNLPVIIIIIIIIITDTAAVGKFV